ncbi:MAG: hypothetical protein SAK29_36730 [Scytonema sp. PMC 1069.18]|nr:hypothetical protein [Scytonema sp. PMC 1069.18]MEC4885708.1 hypothetical protein [Scytonema sp. PMC 1070.18]
MLATDTLAEDQWKTVYAMAQMLANEQTDVNEVGKIIAYLRAYGHVENGGKNFFQYLSVLVRNGKTVGHSGRTFDYYQSIEKACKQYLLKYQNDVPAMLQILGWVTRIMRYYKAGGSTDFVEEQPSVTANFVQATPATPSQQVKVGDIVDATITKKKNVEITYKLLNSISLSQKEHKQANSLSEGQTVKLEITEVREDGRPKKVRLRGVGV